MTRALSTGRSRSYGLLPVYPLVAVAAWVLNAWAMSAITPHSAVRTLGLALLLTALWLGAMRIVFRDWHRGAFATLIAAVILSRDPLAIFGFTASMEVWQRVILLGLIGAALAYAALLLRRALSGRWEMATRALNLFSVMLAAVVLLTAFSSGAIAQGVRDLSRTPSALPETRGVAGPSEASSYPDVYVILLDGYPRADVLSELYQFDNSPFIEALERRGFDLAQRSRSNYMFTQLTLLTMLEMRHVEEIAFPPVSSIPEVNNALREKLADTRGFAALREHGYQIVVSASGFESVALRGADIYLDDGQLNEFERHVLRRTLVLDILDVVAPDWLPDDHRARVSANFAHLHAVVSTPASQPRFTFIHVPAPHAPYLYEADGTPAPRMALRQFYEETPVEMGISEEEFNRLTGAQIAHLNDLTLAAVDTVLAESERPPVVVVMSDHGTGRDVEYGNPSDPDVSERLRNLFAAYTPGYRSLFPDSATPVNLLPILLNTYLGTDFACQADRTFANRPANLLDLEEVPNPDAAGPYPCGEARR